MTHDLDDLGIGPGPYQKTTKEARAFQDPVSKLQDLPNTQDE